MRGFQLLPPYSRRPPLGARLDRGHALARGLQAAWLLAEGGGAVLYDRAGRQRSLTLTGAPAWAAGTDGPALVLDGGNDYGRAATFELAGDVTYALRVRFTTLEPGATLVLQSGTGAANVLRGVTALETGRWYHAAATLAGTTGTLYLDGRADATGSVAAVASTPGFALGTDPDALATELLAGRVEWLYVWDRALSAREVQQHYRQPYGMFQPARLPLEYVQPEAGLAFGALARTGLAFGALTRSGLQFGALTRAGE